jgi:transposase
VVCGQGRLGVGLLSLIATLREEARLPIATIRWYLRTMHGLALSGGAIVGALRTVAARAGPVVDGIRATIRASPVTHADETGWREGGRNGYVWTFSTPTARYFVRGSREKAVLERELGAAFGGVLVSDFYAAYTNYEGHHQYCWAHLLRDIHDLVAAHPREAGVRGWAEAVHALFARAQAVAAPDPPGRRAAAQALRGELAALCAPFLGDDPAPGAAQTAAPQQGLCRRMVQHLAELFVFVADPAVPATNNAAERSLRHLVICRKISGGTRSAAGSATKMALASLFGTWRAQGLNPLEQCRRLLAAPQP